VDKKPGDDVFAGTQNLTGVLEIKVSRAGTDTTLGRVRELILARRRPGCPHEDRGPVQWASTRRWYNKKKNFKKLNKKNKKKLKIKIKF